MLSSIRNGSIYATALALGVVVLLGYLLLRFMTWLFTLVATLSAIGIAIFWCAYVTGSPNPIVWVALVASMKMFAFYGTGTVILYAVSPFLMKRLEQ